MDIFFKADGIKNPVLAARLYFKALEIAIDEESFDDVAFCVGEIKYEGGFLVDSIVAVQKLCEIGNFQILYKNRKVVARTGYWILIDPWQTR